VDAKSEEVFTAFRDAFCELLVYSAEIERVKEHASANECNARLAELFPKLREAAGKFVPLYDACVKVHWDRMLN
jgi:hypothetical protein